MSNDAIGIAATIGLAIYLAVHFIRIEMRELSQKAENQQKFIGQQTKRVGDKMDRNLEQLGIISQKLGGKSYLDEE